MSEPTAQPFLVCMNPWCRAMSLTLFSESGWHGGMCEACWYRYCGAGSWAMTIYRRELASPQKGKR